MELINMLSIFLGAVTLIFGVVGVLSIRTFGKRGDITEAHFEYSKNQFTSIGENLSKLSESIELKISPQIESIYARAQGRKDFLESETLIKILQQIGYKSKEIGKDKTVILGIETENIKVSFFFTIKNENRDLTIFSFSNKIDFGNPSLLKDVLRLKSEYEFGSVEVGEFGRMDILMFRDVVIPYDNISPNLIEEIIGKHMDFHGKVYFLIKNRDLPVDHIGFDHFFKALAESKENKGDLK